MSTTPRTSQIISQPTNIATCLSFSAKNGYVLIHSNGRVELDGCELDEAALCFWKAVGALGVSAQAKLAAALQLQSEPQSALQWAKEELAAVTAERDALKHALIELEAAAEAYAADQSRATDSRCGLVQPITVEDGNRLLSALKIANELTK